jgi:hypothetical protein
MKLFVLMMVLFAGQLNGPQNGSILRLSGSHDTSIPATAGGQVVELLNVPMSVSLPRPVPKRDAQGNAWWVEVKNIGSNDVSVVAMPAFEQMGPQLVVLLHPTEKARIRANGSSYTVIGH